MIRTIVGYLFLSASFASTVYLIDIGVLKEWVLTPVVLSNALSSVFLSRPPITINGG